MSTAYLWLLAFHVLAALWVTVSAFGSTVLRASLKRAPDLAARVTILRIGLRIGITFGMIGGILVGLSGIAVAGKNGAYLHAGWVHAAIGLWVLMLIFNIGFAGPRMRRMLAAGEASLAAGAPTEELERLMAHPIPPGVADLPAIAILLFVWLMVFKPF